MPVDPLTVNTRQLWVDTLLKVASPVFNALSREELRKQMPVQSAPGVKDRSQFSHLEAVGRSLAGIGPWLELNGGICRGEDLKRQGLLESVLRGLSHAVDSTSPDFLNFREGSQPVVDGAFLALGLLRSWNTVWLKLPAHTRDAIVECLMATRTIKPHYNNWLLFSAMVEAFLFKAGHPWDAMRVDYAVRQHEQWYKGDGIYGDGPDFHWDYYNSFVIHPMLYEIVHIGGELSDAFREWQERASARAQRYAVIQERLIGPDGTFAPIGRSLSYRFGAFHLLSLMVLRNNLPQSLSPASVRCALTAALKQTMHAKGTFDREGWLRIGLSGDQPSLGEKYISTGSLYLALCGFLPLGLPEGARFWSETDEDWSSRKLWNGEDGSSDHAV